MATDVAGGDSPCASGSASGELDSNGFPLRPSSSSPDSGASTFEAEFYRSGTDWSSLALPPQDAEEAASGSKGGGGGLLVQRSLFQIWGIEKPSSKRDGAVVGSTARVRVSSSAAASSMSRKRPRGGEGAEVEVAREPRACPFYKRIAGTPFTVDAFRYGAVEGCSAYFLSHFHYDHYGGLTKKWCNGRIYCSALTARLVQMCLSVNSDYICPLELDTEYVIEGVRVTMLEANHCPGAALIHFRLSDGRVYLHTGDFRACKSMQSHLVLLNSRVNVLYLDTTYCNPRYRFPPKKVVVDFVVRTARRYLQKQPKTLIVVGAYSIGKENVYLAISQSLEVPIYTDASRRRILQSFGWSDLSKRLCSCSESSPLHVLPLSLLRHENLKNYLETHHQRYLEVLAFRPTGWTFSMAVGDQLDLIKPSSKGNVTIYGVPYSEHSSFTELRDFVKFLRPGKIIPTVGVGNTTNRDKMQAYFREWLKVV